MSKSSPITNRIQKALYMRSALKQDDKVEKDVTNTGPETFVDSSRGDEILKGRVVETPAEYGTKQIQDVGKQTYTYDMMRADAIQAGMSEADADAQVADAKAYNISKYGTHSPTAAGKTDNTRDVGKVDADGNPIMIDDPSGEQVITKPASKEFKAEQVPQDFDVLSQYGAGQAHRGNRKKINTTMRTEGKLGAFKGTSPSGNKKWTKQEKKLYAAQLLSGGDPGGYGTGIGIGGQSYESNKMVFQKGVGGTENQKYTNINDPKYKTSKKVVKGGGVEEKDDEALAMRSPLKARGTKALKSIKKGIERVSKVDPKVPSIVKKKRIVKKKPVVKKKVDPKKVELEIVKPKVEKPKLKGDGPTSANRRQKIETDAEYNARMKKDYPNKGKNLDGGGGDKKTLWQRYKSKWYTPGRTAAGVVAGAVGMGLLTPGSGGDEETTPIPIVPPKTDDDPTPVTPPKVDPITPPVTTGGGGDDIKVTGADSGILVDKDKTPNVKGPGDRLSSSMRRFNERQAKKKARAEGRQERKDLRQAGRLKRKANRLAAKTIAGKTKSFGGKKHDTNIDNMGVITVPGYKQKDKKKKGNAANWGSTYSA